MTTPSATIAVSLDGRLFRFDGTSTAPFVPGGFVTITEPNGRVQIGQVDALEYGPGGELAGAGTLLAAITAEGLLDRRATAAFTTAELAPADADTIGLVHSEAGAALAVGSLQSAADIPARLVPNRFNRHTFWCGQSGSGKTYALGVVLEQLLVHAALPMVIFDPNADFVRMRELTSAGSPEERDALQERDIRVLRPGRTADSLYARFTSLSMRAKAAILRLDPVADRVEYNALLRLEDTVGSGDADAIIPRLRASADESAHALALRVENLRLVDWEVWAQEHRAVTEILDERPDATVLDLGGFAYADEQLVVAMSVLDDLWAKREERRPILIVIDEAHNLCSPDDDGPLHRAVRERIIQIAAEGRKFGLWLLLSTQRPSKIHPSIISQCDNLALMKMSSPTDLDELATIFGYAPPALLARAPRFRQGEVLFAGGFVPAPILASMRTRLTVEGGVDVRVPLR
ncbi:MAG TPA: ATP-binding protein [Diaminobutyricibacter sp.]